MYENHVIYKLLATLEENSFLFLIKVKKQKTTE